MALEIKTVPPAQLVNRLISNAYALNNELALDPPIEPLPKLLGDRLDVFIKTFEAAFEQFRYALRTVLKAVRDADSLGAGADAEATVRKLLGKPRGECEDARRHAARVRREIDTLKLLLKKNELDAKSAAQFDLPGQIDTAHAYLHATLDAARRRLDALDKEIRAKARDEAQPDAKASTELARLQAAGAALQRAFQLLDQVYRAQLRAVDKALANRDLRALAAAADAVAKPLVAWQGLFKGSRAQIEDFKKKSGADKDLAAQAEKLLAALDEMVSSVMGIVNWKGALPKDLATPDYAKWLKALKLDKVAYAKQLVVNLEYATRAAPVDTWARAFDRIIASLEIPKARGSDWLNTLLRAQLVPTFE